MFAHLKNYKFENPINFNSCLTSLIRPSFAEIWSGKDNKIRKNNISGFIFLFNFKNVKLI